MFHYNADGSFTRILDGPIATEGAISSSGTWADYDHDGDLDVFLPTGGAPGSSVGPFALFQNDGAGHFTKMTANEVGPLLDEQVNAVACTWGDYDNDGWLDLYIADGWHNESSRSDRLYRNNGDGTFTKITRGSPATEKGAGMSANWVDTHGGVISGDYDSYRGVGVLFGGYTLPSMVEFSDIWEWNGLEWSEANVQGSPGPRFGHAMAYDPKRRRVVLFGGGGDLENEGTRFRNDVWELGLMPLRLTVTSGPRDGMLEIQWTGEAPPYQLQTCADLNTGDWQNEGAPTNESSTKVEADGAAKFFRVLSGFGQ